MSRVTELEKALTTLFRKGTEVGYTETEIDEFLENIDYHALLQAVWNKAETVYAYRADGKNALSLDYRSSELFKQRATLLYLTVAGKCPAQYFKQKFYGFQIPGGERNDGKCENDRPHPICWRRWRAAASRFN